STEEIYPHVLLADDQLARAAATGLDIAVIGKGMPLQRVLIPTHAAEETVLHRRFWVRWWAKPTQAWLEKQAMRRSRALLATKPTERHVVIHRFAPELDGDSSWVNKWRVGTLHVARTLDTGAGAVVHGEVDVRELHDPTYVASDHATTTLLAM